MGWWYAHVGMVGAQFRPPNSLCWLVPSSTRVRPLDFSVGVRISWAWCEALGPFTRFEMMWVLVIGLGPKECALVKPNHHALHRPPPCRPRPRILLGFSSILSTTDAPPILLFYLISQSSSSSASIHQPHRASQFIPSQPWQSSSSPSSAFNIPQSNNFVLTHPSIPSLHHNHHLSNFHHQHSTTNSSSVMASQIRSPYLQISQSHKEIKSQICIAQTDLQNPSSSTVQNRNLQRTQATGAGASRRFQVEPSSSTPFLTARWSSPAPSLLCRRRHRHRKTHQFTSLCTPCSIRSSKLCRCCC